MDPFSVTMPDQFSIPKTTSLSSVGGAVTNHRYFFLTKLSLQIKIYTEQTPILNRGLHDENEDIALDIAIEPVSDIFLFYRIFFYPIRLGCSSGL